MRKEFAHRLLRLATDSVIAFARAAISVGVRVGLAEPTASGTLISPKLFQELALKDSSSVWAVPSHQYSTRE